MRSYRTAVFVELHVRQDAGYEEPVQVPTCTLREMEEVSRLTLKNCSQAFRTLGNLNPKGTAAGGHAG